MRTLIFLFFYFYISQALAICDVNSYPNEYRYGKLFFKGEVHSSPEVYRANDSLSYSGKFTDIFEHNKGPYAKFISAFLSVYSKDNHLVARLVIDNDSHRDIAIHKSNIPVSWSLAKEIFLINMACVHIDYLGPTVNFGPGFEYPQDYIIVKSGASHVSEVNLDEYYLFLPGEYHYRIEIPDIYAGYKTKKEWKEVSVYSNQVELKIDGRVLDKKER